MTVKHFTASVSEPLAQLNSIAKAGGTVVHIERIPGTLQSSRGWSMTTQDSFWHIIWSTDDGMPEAPGPKCTNCLAPLVSVLNGAWRPPDGHGVRPDGSLMCPK